MTRDELRHELDGAHLKTVLVIDSLSTLAGFLRSTDSQEAMRAASMVDVLQDTLQVSVANVLDGLQSEEVQ